MFYNPFKKNSTCWAIVKDLNYVLYFIRQENWTEANKTIKVIRLLVDLLENELKQAEVDTQLQ